MDKHLIDQFVSAQFINKLMLVKQSGLVESKGRINAVVGNRSDNNIVIMCTFWWR